MTTSIPGSTVPQLLEFWAKSSQNGVAAFVSVNDNGTTKSVSRKQIFQLAKRLAHQLHVLGISKTSVVCNALPNSVERLVCEFGINLAGGTSMNGQILRSDGEDFLESLRWSKCCMVMLDPDETKTVRKVLLGEVPIGCEDHVKSKRLPNLKYLFKCRRDQDFSKDFLSSLENSSYLEYMASIEDSDIATIMTTSGSTGFSKLVLLSHRNICHFCKQVKAIEPLQPGSRFINNAPLGWAGGYPQWYLSLGITRYFIDLYNGPPADIPATIWRTVTKENIEYGFISPMYVGKILAEEKFWKNSLWRPRTLCLAGQPIRKQQLEIIGKLCDSVDINYGMTECNLVTTHRVTNASQYRDGCAGYPGYEVKVKVVDKAGNEVPQGALGEIVISSPALCHSIIKQGDIAVMTKWLCTDDAGYLGDDGRLYVQGRCSDTIVRGTYILYPVWMEEKLRLIISKPEGSGIKDIAIVAVPDSVLHHEICACVATSETDGCVAGVGHLQSSEKILSESQIVCSSKKQVMGKQNDNSIVEIELENGLNVSEDSGCDTLSLNLSPEVKQLNSSHFNVTSNWTRDSRLKQLEHQVREFADSLILKTEQEAMKLVPKYYVFLDKFPYTTTGKLDRKRLRDLAKDLLYLS